MDQNTSCAPNLKLDTNTYLVISKIHAGFADQSDIKHSSVCEFYPINAECTHQNADQYKVKTGRNA